MEFLQILDNLDLELINFHNFVISENYKTTTSQPRVSIQFFQIIKKEFLGKFCDEKGAKFYFLKLNYMIRSMFINVLNATNHFPLNP